MSKRPASIWNDPGYFYNRKRLGRIFAVSSGLLLLGLAWIVWVDFDRDWKEVQRKQMKWEAKKLALEGALLEARVSERRAELDSAREKALKELEAEEGGLDERDTESH